MRPPGIRPFAPALVIATILAAGCSSAADEAASQPESTTTSAAPTTTTIDDTPTTEASATPDTEAPETTIPGLPPLFEGERFVVVGSNAWPVVGDLLAIGVTPVAIFSQLGNQEQPDYLTEAHGDVLAEVDVQYVNLIGLTPEQLLLLDFDRVVMPDWFEALVSADPVWGEVLADGERAIFLPVQNWRESIGALADAAGENADPVIDDLEARYAARLADIAEALPYDPSQVVFNTFQWNEDGTYLTAWSGVPIVQVMRELGFALHPSLEATEQGQLTSLETVTDMDADLVAIQVRNTEFDSLVDDPLWSGTRAAQTGNQFERFQFGQQAGWLETLELLDQLEIELPRYVPG